jgi:uncharacterized membrane protein YkvA (DUF1232 family)
MGKRSVSKRGLWGEIKRQARLIVRLMRDSRVPLWMRAIPILGIVYMFSPIGLIPDFTFLPLGILDNLIVITICLTIFMAIVPRAIVDDHLSWLDAADITIDDLRDTPRLSPPRRGKK